MNGTLSGFLISELFSLKVSFLGIANLYQKCLILCSPILLNVLHNLSLTVLFP